MISVPVRSAHVASCSAAAARNVSAAASTTRRPSSFSRCASLAMLVVFPTPLTPTNIQTLGFASPWCSSRSASASSVTSSSRSSAMTRSGSAVFSALARSRTASITFVVVGTPTSARISASSRSSHVSSSTLPRPAIPANAPANAARVLPSRSRRRGLTRSTGSTSGSGSDLGLGLDGLGLDDGRAAPRRRDRRGDTGRVGAGRVPRLGQALVGAGRAAREEEPAADQDDRERDDDEDDHEFHRGGRLGRALRRRAGRVDDARARRHRRWCRPRPGGGRPRRGR